MLEVLSPAGSPESVVAAVQSGADAIYLGLGGFNARQGAKNFTQEEFLQAVEYCRVRGCKVYVALNTLASDRELGECANLARFVYEAGADAALVQDLGVARVLQAVCPELPLHASTQMSVHSLAGALAAAQLGFRRVVLARELTGEQIRFIAEHSPIEVEVFVHGALCVCHSGQCYLSALIGRRSGNRGMCAQPCRLPYSMGRRMAGYPLSLKDNCLVEHLAELEEAGVACIKIEGRMKRPEYTAITTGIYARAVHERAVPTEKDFELLREAFSRSGFTDGYYTGEKTDMHGVREDPDRETQRRFTEVRRGYTGVEMRRVPVDFYTVVGAGVSRLMVTDDEGRRVAVQGPRPERAQFAPLDEQEISDRLYKTGGTPYLCRHIKTALEDNIYLPAAAINDMRRRALDELTDLRRQPPKRRVGDFPQRPDPEPLPERMALTMQVLSETQLTPELCALKPTVLYVPVQLLSEHYLLAAPFADAGCELCAVLPRVFTDSETEEIAALLKRLQDLGIKSVLAGNLGHIAIAMRCGMAVRGDFGLNVFNSFTLDTLRRAGLLSATASFELRLPQVRDLIKSVNTELIIYGRLPCMVTEIDLVTQASGSESAQSVTLSDRMGSAFPVAREFGYRSVIYNAHKLFLADKIEDLASAGLWAGRLLFTTETPRECVQVAKCYMGQSDYEPNGLTRGLYYRGVE